MSNTNYKAMLINRVHSTLEEWSGRPHIEEKEIYLFLHNLKGTSGTVGLVDIEKWAEAAMELFSHQNGRTWSMSEWGEHFIALDELCSTSTEEVDIAEETNSIQPFLNSSYYRVLMIDSDIHHCIYIKEMLEKKSYSVNIALTAVRGLRLFYDWSPQLILLTSADSINSGIGVLNSVIEKAKLSRIPVVILSSQPTLEHQIQAYQSGVMDYFPTSVDIQLLTALLDNRIGMKQEWELSVHTDELTGAFNRKHFNQALQHIISDYTRTQRISSLAIMDLDHFKRVNDTYGHLKGDEVLKKFVAVIKEIIREMDILCRYGGEEFALLFPNTDASQAVSLLQRIRDAFAEQEFESDKEPFHVTFSAGVTEISATNSHAEQLIEEADLALYAGKHSGRNQTVIYNDSLLVESKVTQLHFIVIDDDALIRKMVVSKLRSNNPFSNGTQVNVQEFADGNMFLESDWYKPEESYIIILDGMMPGLDGIEVLKKIRADYPENWIQVIMLTARNNQEDIVQALQIGADDYMVKPFHMPELISRIERLAKRIGK